MKPAPMWREALESVNELETNLDQSKGNLCTSCLMCGKGISKNDLDELKRRCNEVKDFMTIWA